MSNSNNTSFFVIRILISDFFTTYTCHTVVFIISVTCLIFFAIFSRSYITINIIWIINCVSGLISFSCSIVTACIICHIILNICIIVIRRFRQSFTVKISIIFNVRISCISFFGRTIFNSITFKFNRITDYVEHWIANFHSIAIIVINKCKRNIIDNFIH